MIGTLLLWVYWPAFNFGVYATTTFERTQIIGNTLFSLAGSSLATFIVTSMHGRGILIEDMQHASIVGGVAIGASAGVLYLPPVALVIGFLAGVISTNALHYLNKKLEKSLKLFDVLGVHSTHGLPGIFGGVASAIIIAFYNKGYDADVAALYFKDSNNNTFLSPNTDFMGKAGLQMAAVGISFGLAVIGGIVAGKFIGLFYEEKAE
jgi:ammonium transporter Rh